MFRQKGSALPVAIVLALIMMVVAIAASKRSSSAMDESMALSMRDVAMNLSEHATNIASAALLGRFNTNVLTDDDEDEGYYATSNEYVSNIKTDWNGSITPGDATDDVDWEGGNNGVMKAKAIDWGTLADDSDDVLQGADGFDASYVIERMCKETGETKQEKRALGAPPQSCLRFESASQSQNKGGASYGGGGITPLPQIYYRITTRVVGPKGATTFSQAHVLIDEET